MIDKNIEPSEWLNLKCNKRDISSHELKLDIPQKSDGTQYDIEGLFEDQLTVVLLIINKIIEWTSCKDLSKFEPLRITINGPAGTGKTVVINTIVTLIRTLFQTNGVVQVCAPTGTAAFNERRRDLAPFPKKQSRDESI